MPYDKQQFEAAFQLLTAVSHQVIKIDYMEIGNWVQKIMGPEALNDPEKQDNMDRLITVLQAYGAMQQVLLEKGVPVRDITHYQEGRMIDNPRPIPPGAPREPGGMD